MRCHATGAPLPGITRPAPVIDPATHSHHGAEGTDATCVTCHMPVTTYMQRHPRHDHGFTIPDPLLTKKFGIPNACNRCAQKEFSRRLVCKALSFIREISAVWPGAASPSIRGTRS